MPNVTLPRADIPIDSAGNFASRDLYRWMSDMTSRVGGTTGALPEASESFEDAGIEETKAQFYQFNNDVGQAPVIQELMFMVDTMAEQLASQAALIAELSRHINGMEQETLQ